eukprot:jgi/Botrbrau1/8665/Bobra.0087s0018.1
MIFGSQTLTERPLPQPPAFERPCVRAFHMQARLCRGDSSKILMEMQKIGNGPPLLSVALQFTIVQANTHAEFRATGDLRARAFAVFPKDRSEMARQAYCRMRAEGEWQGLEARLSGTDETYKGVHVTCYIALLDDRAGDPWAQKVRAELDPSCKIPGSSCEPARLVIGSLDLNQGSKLPCEELVGRYPEGPKRSHERAYISNVSVASETRRQGVAQALMQTAMEEAVRRGVSCLYVHVERHNLPARACYQDALGFEVESEETENDERLLNRPRRMLLRRFLGDF